MKKTWILFASITLATSLLTACNTDETTGMKDSTTTKVAPKESVEESPATQTDGEQREQQQSLSFSVNEEMKEEVANLTESDEQNYSIYKLDSFSLTGEEPNKDSLYLTDNSAVFMRIETISKDDASFEIIANNMMETMFAVNLGKEPVKISDKAKLPQGAGISNQIGYQLQTDLGNVTGIVFERGNMIVRLTIFDHHNVDMTDAFLKMGETVATK